MTTNEIAPPVAGHLDLRVEGHIALMTLTRPDKLNALTVATLHALDKACADLEGHHTVRAVIVCSANQKAFSAGADISEWAELKAVDMWRQFNRLGHRVFDRVAQLPQPTIAAIEGVALGGGLELALACDIRIGGSAARLGLPETTIGAVPGWGGTMRLPAAIGRPQAKRLIFSGDIVDAAEAWKLGLLQETVAEGTAMDRARQLAERIAGNAPSAVRMAKQLIDAGHGGLAGETIAAGFGALLEDGVEGARAFREKRQPSYHDA